MLQMFYRITGKGDFQVSVNMFEHKTEPLISRERFLKRLWGSLLLCMAVMAICLVLGVIGFRFINHNSWIDSLHNAAMLLGGMGPVVEMQSTGAKLFSSGYALFSGVVFITNIGLLLTPVIHRVLHHFHVQDGAGK